MHVDVVWAHRGQENYFFLKSKFVNLKYIDAMIFLKFKCSANDWGSVITIAVSMSSKRNDQV